MRKYKIYAAFNENNELVTYGNSYNECNEYVNKLVFFNHIEHFINWCSTHNLNYNKDDLEGWKLYWDEYVKLMIDNKEFSKFLIKRLTFNVKDVAEIFRVADKCIPLGCSYESQYEKEFFMKNILSKINNN